MQNSGFSGDGYQSQGGNDARYDGTRENLNRLLDVELPRLEQQRQQRFNQLVNEYGQRQAESLAYSDDRLNSLSQQILNTQAKIQRLRLLFDAHDVGVHEPAPPGSQNSGLSNRPGSVSGSLSSRGSRVEDHEVTSRRSRSRSPPPRSKNCGVQFGRKRRRKHFSHQKLLKDLKTLNKLH